MKGEGVELERFSERGFFRYNCCSFQFSVEYAIYLGQKSSIIKNCG